MAEIEYEVREQDLVAFNEQQLKNSRRLQKTLRRHQATIPAFMILIALFLLLYAQNTLAAIFVAVSGAAWGVLAPFYLRWSIRRQFRQMYSEEEKAAVLGNYRLRTEPDALVEITAQGETRVKWDDILRIECTNNHAFVFVETNTALIIPRVTVKSGNLLEFVQETDQYIERAA